MDGYDNVIHPSVVMGKGVTIGHFNVIYEGVELGEGTVVGNHCELGKNLKTGKNVIIQGRVRIANNCVIEDDVELKIGTILTSGVLLKKGSFMGPCSITLGSSAYRVTKHGTTIGERTYIGGGAKIAADIQIGDDIVVGAQAFVNKDLIEPGVYGGIPAILLKKHSKKFYDSVRDLK